MEYNRENCKGIYFNLLDLLRHPDKAALYLRGLEDASQCDPHFDHSYLRHRWRHSLGSDRILSYDFRDSDELKAIKVMIKEKDLHSARIRESFTFRENMEYGLYRFRGLWKPSSII